MWQDVVRLIKWRRVRWVECAACMGKKTLVVSSEGNRPFGVLGAYGLLVSILILNGVKTIVLACDGLL